MRLIYLKQSRFIKSTSQLKHSFKFNKIWGHVTARSDIVWVIWTAYLCSVRNCCFLLTAVSCNVALKCTIFHKLIMNLINTVRIHYNTNFFNCYKCILLFQFLGNNFIYMNSRSNIVIDEMFPIMHEYAPEFSQFSWTWGPLSHPHSSPSEQGTSYCNRPKYKGRLQLLYRLQIPYRLQLLYRL